MIYIKFFYYQTTPWAILCDNQGRPFVSIKDAKDYVRAKYAEFPIGLAEYDQMLLNNAQWDNL
jgi:hypothetical protein